MVVVAKRDFDSNSGESAFFDLILMKKLKHLFTSCLVAALFCGCGGDDENAVEVELEDVVLDIPASGAGAPAPAVDPGAPPAPPPPPPVPGTEKKKKEEAPVAEIAPEKVEASVKANMAKEGDSALIYVIQEAVEAYFEDKGELPANVNELLKSKHLKALPNLPTGKKVRINGTTLEVSLENEEAAE